MFNQVSLFDLFPIPSAKLSSADEHAVEIPEEKDSQMDYLSRGEKIMSLLRKRKKKSYKANSFLDAINISAYRKNIAKGGDHAANYVRSSVGKKIIGPAFSKIANDSGEMSENGEKKFLEMFEGIATFEFIKNVTSYAEDICETLAFRSKFNFVRVVGIRFKDRKPDEEVVLIVGKDGKNIKKNQHAGNWHKKGSMAIVKPLNPSIFFADAYILVQLRKRFREVISSLPEERREDNSVVSEYVRLQQDVLTSHRVLSNTLYIRQSVYDIPYIKSFMDKYCDEFTILGDDSEMTAGVSASSFPFAYIIGDGELVTEEKRLYNLVYLYSQYMVDALNVLLDEYQEEKNERKLEKQLASDYATSYETKKNIPQKMLSAMEKSDFNNTFGYVEFDEECDLEQISIIEKEFQALKDFLDLGEHKEVSLRFRKLGQHKAAGLYYPVLKCLCVDVRTPSSMAHELMHMYDYENGSLSKSGNFYPVLEKYREEFDRISEGRELKGKYDADYYKSATEVFARCGEIFLTRICHVDNSIVKPDFGMAYPESDELDGLICEYYSKLFPSTYVIGEDRRKAASA